MIDLEFLETLIRTLDESGIDSIEIERGGTRIRLSKTPQAAVTDVAAEVTTSPQTQTSSEPTGAPEAVILPESESAGAPAETPAADGPEPAGNLVEITSPMVGTFYRSPAPDAPTFVEVGASVSPGDTLCIIEAMKLMNELPAEVSGTIVEICVEDAEPVEYGQVLFRLNTGGV